MPILDCRWQLGSFVVKVESKATQSSGLVNHTWMAETWKDLALVSQKRPGQGTLSSDKAFKVCEALGGDVEGMSHGALCESPLCYILQRIHSGTMQPNVESWLVNLPWIMSTRVFRLYNHPSLINVCTFLFTVILCLTIIYVLCCFFICFSAPVTCNNICLTSPAIMSMVFIVN